eukprot:TRINITY_DN97_c0_g1_i1.p1 TRINITY_DN97_c0_g1~~TRINITY_DN97_c0_g1_i1.p1  ORF type:complete len:571 (+),score=164.01 TRINITY_DN97_c0_g1_i1:125-1837(+)
MGNNQECCGRRKETKPLAFSGTELRNLDKTFADIKSKDSATESKRFLSAAGFRAHFEENPEFGEKLFRWCLKATGGEGLDLESYRSVVESLLRDAVELGDGNPWGVYEKFELFFFASAEIYDVDQDKLEKLKVSYLQVLNFFLDLLRTFDIARPSSKKDLELAARVASDGLFAGAGGAIPYLTFVRLIKARYRRINKVISIYLSYRLLHPTGKSALVVPAFDKPSLILLNRELLKLLALSHDQFAQSLKLQQLYSTTGSYSFDGLVAVLDSFKGPTMFLLKHVDQKDGGIYVVGGLMTSSWNPPVDNEEFRGDENAIVFGIYPGYKPYFSKRGDLTVTRWAEKVNGQGLGFVGKNGKRLWIAANLDRDCVIGTDDGSFEPGYLLEPHITNLRVETLEVWGLAVENLTPTGQGLSPIGYKTTKGPSSARPSARPVTETEAPQKQKNMDELLAKLSYQLGPNDSRLSSSRTDIQPQASVQEPNSGTDVRFSKKVKDIKFQGDVRRVFERFSGNDGYVNSSTIPQIFDQLKREEEIISQIDVYTLDNRLRALTKEDSVFIHNFIEAVNASRKN